jgi:hypothetical protein
VRQANLAVSENFNCEILSKQCVVNGPKMIWSKYNRACAQTEVSRPAADDWTTGGTSLRRRVAALALGKMPGSRGRYQSFVFRTMKTRSERAGLTLKPMPLDILGLRTRKKASEDSGRLPEPKAWAKLPGYAPEDLDRETPAPAAKVLHFDPQDLRLPSTRPPGSPRIWRSHPEPA